MKMHLLLVLASIVGTMVSPALAQQNQSDSRVALLIANSNYPEL